MAALDKLKRRLDVTDKDALLCDLIEDAQTYLLAYTGRGSVPEGCEGCVVELAAIAYTRMGMEGQQSHSEGGVSVAVEGLPAMLKAQLDRLRVAKVG